MTSRLDVMPLADLQARFAAALRGGVGDDTAAYAMSDSIVDDSLAPARRLRIYQNNVRAMFEGALARTYPVLKQKIGDEAFSLLAAEYRDAHPSRSGDLHWVGQAFPDWLTNRDANRRGDDALVDLARLEWACEEVLVAPLSESLDRAALARVPTNERADTRLSLQPGLRIVSSTRPIWSEWRAHQSGHAERTAGDMDGDQHVIAACVGERLTLRSVPREHAEFIRELVRGATLAGAIDASGMPLDALPGVLGWLFDDGLVVSLSSPSERSLDRGPT